MMREDHVAVEAKPREEEEAGEMQVEQDTEKEASKGQGESGDDFKVQVEEGEMLSSSVLWQQMRRFYESQGVEAWARGIVPFFITCNAFIAKSYAKVLTAYLHDLASRGELSPQEPVYILELGAGSGKFSFLLLKALLERLEAMYDGQQAPFRVKYIMSDFCESPFKFWKEHPNLKRYMHAGVLDFCTFDACHGTSIRLQVSNKVLHRLQNPLLVVANYLFDSLPADAYRFRDGRILEGRVSIFSRVDEPDRSDPAILQRFKAVFDWVEAKPRKGATAPVVEEILLWYQRHFGTARAAGLVPTASLDCLENLRRFSEKVCVLSGDKGTSNTLAMKQGANEDPHIAVHGSFSLMVNYHTIGLWFQAHGGFALHCPLEDAALKVSCFVLDQGNAVRATEQWNARGDPPLQATLKYPNLKLAFREAVAGFGPDNFFHLQCADSLKEQDIRSIIALLQLSDWDPDLAFKFREQILDSLGAMSAKQLQDLKRGMHRAWENYFALESDKDFCFELGRFHYGLSEFQQALVFYCKSMETAGSHHVTEHNIGLCHLSLGNQKLALESFQRSLALNANYVKAQQQCEKLHRDLNLPKPPQPLDVATCGQLLLSVAHSPLNTSNRRVTFDPEVLERKKSLQDVPIP